MGIGSGNALLWCFVCHCSALGQGAIPYWRGGHCSEVLACGQVNVNETQGVVWSGSGYKIRRVVGIIGFESSWINTLYRISQDLNTR